MYESKDIVFVWLNTFPKDTSLHNCVKLAKFQDQAQFEAVCAQPLWPKVKHHTDAGLNSSAVSWSFGSKLMMMMMRHPRRNIKNKWLKFLTTGKTLHLFVTSGFPTGFFAPTAFSFVNIRARPYFYTQQIIQGSNSDVTMNWNRERKIKVENVEHAKREKKHFTISLLAECLCPLLLVCLFCFVL